MNHTYLVNVVQMLSLALQVLIILRVIMSWVRPHPGKIGGYLLELTDPLLMPFQRILPPMAGLDFSPLLALVTIQILSNLALSALGS